MVKERKMVVVKPQMLAVSIVLFEPDMHKDMACPISNPETRIVKPLYKIQLFFFLKSVKTGIVCRFAEKQKRPRAILTRDLWMRTGSSVSLFRHSSFVQFISVHGFLLDGSL